MEGSIVNNAGALFKTKFLTDWDGKAPREITNQEMLAWAIEEGFISQSDLEIHERKRDALARLRNRFQAEQGRKEGFTLHWIKKDTYKIMPRDNLHLLRESHSILEMLALRAKKDTKQKLKIDPKAATLDKIVSDVIELMQKQYAGAITLMESVSEMTQHTVNCSSCENKEKELLELRSKIEQMKQVIG